MRNSLLTIVILLTSPAAFASNVFCEAWYQEPNQPLTKEPMVIDSETANNIVFKTNSRGYDFKVDWNKPLTTFYVSIENAGKRILMTTARVPTENHPENFTDLHLPGGPRLSVNCEMR